MKKIVLISVLILLFVGGALANDFSQLLPHIGTGAASDGEDLARVEQRVFEFEAELGALEAKLKAVQKEEESLANQVAAFQINGSTLGQLRRMVISGQGATSSRDFLGRPLWYDFVEESAGPQTRGNFANQRMTLKIVGKPVPQIEITSDLSAASAWAGNRTFSVDNIAVRTHFGGLYTETGVFHRAFSPLTLYWATPTVWFESELFSQQRYQYSRELQQKDHLRRLEGFATDFVQDNFLVQGLIARVRDGNPYQRFLTGFNVNLFPGRNKKLAARYLELKDDAASGTTGIARSELLGVGINWPVREELHFGGEYVRSIYNKNELTSVGDIKDFAVMGDLGWSNFGLELQGRALYVGAHYYAPSSQSRDYVLSDPSIFGPASALTAMGGTVSHSGNQALPYGLSTPNRRGIQLRASYPWGKRTKLAAELTGLSELEGATDSGELSPSIDEKRSFLLLRAGASYNLTGLEFRGYTLTRPLQLLGQLEQRLVHRDSSVPGLVRDQKITFWDLGLDYEFQPSWKLLLGTKIEVRDQAGEKSNHSTVAAGLKTVIGSRTTASLAYRLVDFQGNNDSSNYRGNLLELVVQSNF